MTFLKILIYADVDPGQLIEQVILRAMFRDLFMPSEENIWVQIQITYVLSG